MAEMTYKLKEESILPLYEQWINEPTSENFQKLYRAAEPVINYAIGYYAKDLANSPSLKLKAKKIVYECVKNYDKSKGSLVNYLMMYLQRLQRYAGQQRRMIQQSENLAMKLMDLQKTEQELSAELGRAPTTIELADKMGISVDAIERIRKRGRIGIAESQVPEWVEGRQLGYESEEMMDLLKNYYYFDADPASKYILEHKFGLFGRPIKSNTEIAKDLGMSPSAITQRIDKIYNDLVRLKEELSLVGGI